MGDQPPPAPQLSPDGKYYWDGQRWMPTGSMAPFQPARPPGSRAWIWWVAGGCATLLIIAIVAGIFGFANLIKNFQGGAYSCLPSDFPNYPGASVVRENNTVGTHNECDMTLSSSDDVATVTSFYASHLSEGDWRDQVNSSSGVISFQQTSGGHATGEMQLLGAGQHTEIRISVIT